MQTHNRYEKWNRTKNDFALVIWEQSKVVVVGVFGEKDFKKYGDAKEFLETHEYQRA